MKSCLKYCLKKKTEEEKVGVFQFYLKMQNLQCSYKCEPNCIGSSFNILVFLWVWLFSGMCYLCPLAGSNQSWQHFLWLSGLGPFHPWLAESVRKAFARSFWNTGKVLSGSGKSADFCSSCYWTLRDKILSSFGLWISFAHGAGGAEATMAVLSWLGAKSRGWQVGKDPALAHSTEMAVRKQSCTGHVHPQPCSEHILSQTFNLHCLSIKKKKAHFCSLLLVSKCQLLEIESGFNFSGFPVISGVLSCEEEEREQPDFLKNDQSLTWICLPNPTLQWE